MFGVFPSVGAVALCFMAQISVKLFFVSRGRREAYTQRVCLFLSGMNGKPTGGIQFDHVPFFKGEVSLAERG